MNLMQLHKVSVDRILEKMEEADPADKERLDNPFMPEWTFPPAIHDMPRWNGFSDADVSAIAHQKAESLMFD
jgi:hypothetical protein